MIALTPIETRALRDLAAGPTTADSAGPRLDLDHAAALVVFRRLQTASLATPHPISGLLIWHITSRGSQHLADQSKR